MIVPAVVKGLMVSGCIALTAFATDLFKDDFSDSTKTKGNWIANPESLIRKCENGVYTITNNDAQYAGLMVHTLNAPKPSTFTLSGKITRSSDVIPAGFYICVALGSSLKGYAIQLNQLPFVTAYKYSDGKATQLLAVTCLALHDGTNELTVSKRGSEFNVFCNGAHAGSFTDAGPIPPGDIALVIPAKSTAAFDDILLTDEFTTPPPVRPWFKDGFSDNAILGWSDYKHGAVTVEEINNRYLSVNTTAPGSYDYHYTKLALDADTIVSQVIVSYRGGNKSTMYGFCLIGKEDAQNKIPMALFMINGQRQFEALCVGDSVYPGMSTAIHGAVDTNLWDTIEVEKFPGSPYKMIVNSTTLDSLPASKVKFDIVEVGIYTDQGLHVYYDSFFVAKTLNCPVVKGPKWGHTLKNVKFSPYAGPFLFDPLGRVVRTGSVNRKANGLTPGFYVDPKGKRGIVLKKR